MSRMTHNLARSGVACRQGAFLLVDVIRLEGETLEEYHEREVADVSNTWTGLDHEGRESMCDHMMKVWGMAQGAEHGAVGGATISQLFGSSSAGPQWHRSVAAVYSYNMCTPVCRLASANRRSKSCVIPKRSSSPLWPCQQVSHVY